MVAAAPPSSGTRSLPALAKYDVIEEIGHGGMATVYRAMDKRLAREVAVKVIHPHLRDSAEVAHRFVVEAQAVAKLRHANIVEVFDVSSEEDSEKYLVVELIRGSTLRALLKERAPLPPEVGAAIAIDVLAALAHAHAEGVVHRDVKPENVLVEHRALRGDGDTPPPTSGDVPSRVRIKLTDFGIAKLLDAQGVTSTGQVLGSPAHMAPEQIEGGAVDARADVFGVGVMLYESMVGHLPFEGQNPAQVLRRVLDGLYSPADLERATVGQRFSKILDRALAHDPAGRYESANAMREALIVELKRIGVDSPARDLESYFDDPEGYAKDHAKRTITKLCALAQSARKENRSLDAAADYNRALAYAPDDPQLLRIVARMQRDAARARMLKRAAPLVLATIVLMVGAYFLTVALKNRPHPQPLASADSAAATAPSTTASITASATVTASATISATATIASTAPTTSAGARTERTITLSLSPPTGVSVVIDNDDKNPHPKATGETLDLDFREHVLVFSCAHDACEPKTKTIPPGKKDDAITIELEMKKASLTITSSDPNATFGLEEFPEIVIRPNVQVTFPIRSQRLVTLFDRQNPSHKKEIRIRPGVQTTDTGSF